MMPHLSHPDEGMVYACPRCDRADIRHRNPQHPNSQGDTPFQCKNCQYEFETPQERPTHTNRRQHQHGSKSHLEVLLESNPEIREEHAGFERASQIRTDGGTLQFEDLDEGLEIRVDGERFTITQRLDGVLALLPRNENGSGRLERHNEDLWVFTRRRGVIPEEVEVVE